MVQKITWLPAAQSTFSDSLTYLEVNFSEKEIQKFVDRIQQKLLILGSFPGIGSKCKKPGVYKTLIHKKIILFYQYRPLKNEILLLAFWNTLQDPAKLKW